MESEINKLQVLKGKQDESEVLRRDLETAKSEIGKLSR